MSIAGFLDRVGHLGGVIRSSCTCRHSPQGRGSWTPAGSRRTRTDGAGRSTDRERHLGAGEATE